MGLFARNGGRRWSWRAFGAPRGANPRSTIVPLARTPNFKLQSPSDLGLYEIEAQLRESLFEFFDHWEAGSTACGIAMVQKIIGLAPKEWLSFYANRFNWGYEHTKAESYPADGALRSQVNSCGLASALPIVLRRGDALIVDNYRALVRRTEVQHWNWSWLLPWRPRIRWIRMYCGFPAVPRAKGSTSNGHG